MCVSQKKKKKEYGIEGLCGSKKEKEHVTHVPFFFGCHIPLYAAIVAYKYAAKPFPRKNVPTSYILSIKLTIIETNQTKP